MLHVVSSSVYEAQSSKVCAVHISEEFEEECINWLINGYTIVKTLYYIFFSSY